jgi:hypothetical protein
MEQVVVVVNQVDGVMEHLEVRADSPRQPTY